MLGVGLAPPTGSDSSKIKKHVYFVFYLLLFVSGGVQYKAICVRSGIDEGILVALYDRSYRGHCSRRWSNTSEN